MALYEHVLIARPDISPAQVETLMEELSGFLDKQGAKVSKIRVLGSAQSFVPDQQAAQGTLFPVQH